MYFNTSNVTIYQSKYRFNKLEFVISIHLMLLFTLVATLMQIGFIHFNTSNVTIYHFKQCIDFIIKKISIHLMLLFTKDIDTLNILL